MSTDVDRFVQEHQDEIIDSVNKALNRAGDILQQKVAAGEIKPNMQEVLPFLLYEVLVTHTVATLRLADEMLAGKSGAENTEGTSH